MPALLHSSKVGCCSQARSDWLLTGYTHSSMTSRNSDSAVSCWRDWRRWGSPKARQEKAYKSVQGADIPGLLQHHKAGCSHSGTQRHANALSIRTSETGHAHKGLQWQQE